MVLIVTFPRSVGMIRCKGANLKHMNITNTMEQASPSMVMLMFTVAEWYVYVTKTCGKCCCRKVNVNIITKCEGKYRQVIYCCDLTLAESAGTPQLILNLKRQFYRQVISVTEFNSNSKCSHKPIVYDNSAVPGTCRWRLLETTR